MVLEKLHPIRRCEWRVQLREVTEIVQELESKREKQVKVEKKGSGGGDNGGQWSPKIVIPTKMGRSRGAGSQF